MVQESYQTKDWAASVRNPQNRLDIASPIVTNMGGTIECAFIAFGDYDSIAIIKMPHNINAAALSMALLVSGVFKTIKTTPLMTWKDGVEAIKKAKKIAYQPPSEEPIYLNRAR